MTDYRYRKRHISHAIPWLTIVCWCLGCGDAKERNQPSGQDLPGNTHQEVVSQKSPSTVDSQDIVPPPAALRGVDTDVAAAIIFNMTYLPRSPRLGICQVRAFYKTMELAVEKISSSSLVILGTLNAVRGIEWGYHVAPLLIDQNTNEPLIFDFSLAEGPVTVDEWIYLSDQLQPDPAYQFILLQGSEYLVPAIRDNSNLYIDRATLQEKMRDPKLNSKLINMPAFQAADIRRACQLAAENWQYEASDDRLIELQNQLYERTHELIDKLQKLGLFIGDPREVTCT